MNEPVRLSGGGLWVEFVWRGDRWGHRIGVTDSDRGQSPPQQLAAILETLEGTPEQDWPPSPVLQELHLEPRGNGQQLALLVGMAGTSHWSLSMELDPAAGRAVFDVACRVKRAPGELGSTYRRADLPLRVSPPTGPISLPATVQWRYTVSPVAGPERLLLELG